MSDEVAVDRQRWLNAGFDSDERFGWLLLKVNDPDEAREYIDEHNLAFNEAKRWHEIAWLEPYQAVEWRQAGFTPEQAEPWVKALINEEQDYDAEVAAEWRDAGVSPVEFGLWTETTEVYRLEERQRFVEAGLTIDEIRRWRDIPLWITTNEALFAAIADGLDVADPANAERVHGLLALGENDEPVQYWLDLDDILKWREAGFDPTEDQAWVKAFLGDVEEAVEWRTAQFGPNDALAWKEAIVNLEDAIAWRSAGFALDEAKQFEEDGIYDPEEALEELGRSVPPRSVPPRESATYLLRPVATLANNIPLIMDAYAEVRPQLERVDALRAAMTNVLSPTDCAEVIDYFDGQWDDRAGEGDGRKLANGTIESCETFYEKSSRMSQRNIRRGQMDVVALAEDIGTDADLIEAFDNGVQRMDPDSTGALVAQMMVMIGESSSRSWTKTGRKIKIEQAIKVFRSLERKAGLSSQGLWCKAMADALQSQLWRL